MSFNFPYNITEYLIKMGKKLSGAQNRKRKAEEIAAKKKITK
jgi:hypothetical protein